LQLLDILALIAGVLLCDLPGFVGARSRIELAELHQKLFALGAGLQFRKLGFKALLFVCKPIAEKMKCWTL
jgi:hypothetical protein